MLAFFWIVIGIAGGYAVLYFGRFLKGRAPDTRAMRTMLMPTGQLFVSVGYLVLVLTALFSVLYLLFLLSLLV